MTVPPPHHFEVLRPMLLTKMPLAVLTLLFQGAIAAGAGLLIQSSSRNDEHGAPNRQPPAEGCEPGSRPRPHARHRARARPGREAGAKRDDRDSCSEHGARALTRLVAKEPDSSR